MTDGWQLDNPDFIFRDDGLPYNRDYGDIYHQADGFAESQYVFIDGIGAPGCWADKQRFVIAEIGFGTGLNFLATWARWRQTAPARARLHYVAVEKAPLSAKIIRQCHAKRQILTPLVDALCRHNLAASPGFHRFWLDHSRVSLTLLLGEAAAVLGAFEAGTGVDAWYLDGFAPKRNPRAWDSTLFAEIARLCSPGSKLATFSAAKTVCDGLSKVGFEVQKRPGFGHKRDMITARFTGQGPHAKSTEKWSRLPLGRPASGPVAVIGGGVAGAAMVAALTRRGVKADLYERRSMMAAEATAVPAGLVAPPPNLGRTAAEAFQIAAFRYQIDTVRPFDENSPRGIVFWPEDIPQERRLARLVTDQGPVKGLFECFEGDSQAGIWAPLAGSLAGDALASRLCDGLDVQTQKSLLRLQPMSPGWQLIFADGSTGEAETVVLANAGAAADLPQTDWLPLHLVRGQMTAIKGAALAKLSGHGHIGDGYLTAVMAGQRYLGATFDHQGFRADQWPQAVVTSDHMRVLGKSPFGLEGAALKDLGAVVGGWAGLRAFSQDRSALVGPVPEKQAFLHAFDRLRHGDPRAHYPHIPPYLARLYVLAGLGARGLTMAPLAAELLAAQITGEPWPVPRPQAESLAPVRFLARALMRGTTESLT